MFCLSSAIYIELPRAENVFSVNSLSNILSDV